MRSLIENNFNIILIIGFCAGLFLPGLERMPDYAPMICVAAVMFFSCTKISLTDIKTINYKSAALFYILRFLLFPILAYFIALTFVAEYAIGVLIMALMPAGISSIPLANILKGNPSLALVAMMLTHAFIPLALPLISQLTLGQDVHINIIHMMTTLSLTIFIPAILYFGLAKNLPPIKSWISTNAQSASILMIALMVALVTAPHKHSILGDITVTLWPLLIAAILFFALYLIPWLYAVKHTRADRITYTTCSGANNNALGAGVAALYFNAPTVLFCVMCEVVWIAGVALFERFCKAQRKTAP